MSRKTEETIILSPQPPLKIPIPKLFQTLRPPILAEHKDSRQRHPVEGIILAGGIDGHIPEQQEVSPVSYTHLI